MADRTSIRDFLANMDPPMPLDKDIQAVPQPLAESGPAPERLWVPRRTGLLGGGTILLGWPQPHLRLLMGECLAKSRSGDGHAIWGPLTWVSWI